MKKSVLKDPITVYHGMGETECKLFGDKGVGSTFSTTPYLSTSQKEYTAAGFVCGYEKKRRMLVIDLPAGSNGFAFGDGMYESEVLLPRNSNFKITKIDSTGPIEYIHVTPA